MMAGWSWSACGMLEVRRRRGVKSWLVVEQWRRTHDLGRTGVRVRAGGDGLILRRSGGLDLNRPLLVGTAAIDGCWSDLLSSYRLIRRDLAIGDTVRERFGGDETHATCILCGSTSRSQCATKIPAGTSTAGELLVALGFRFRTVAASDRCPAGRLWNHAIGGGNGFLVLISAMNSVMSLQEIPSDGQHLRLGEGRMIHTCERKTYDK